MLIGRAILYVEKQGITPRIFYHNTDDAIVSV